MVFLRVLLTTAVLILIARAVGAAPLIELNTAENSHQGMRVAHDQDSCWLIQDDGSLQQVSLSKVTSHRKTGQEFVPRSANSLADEIRKTLPRQMDVQVRGSFVVVAPAGKSRACADAVASIEKAFRSELSRRNWATTRSQYPLVVVIHASRTDFVEDCRQAGLPVSDLLQGFYHPVSNRVTLFETPADRESGKAVPGVGKSSSPNEIPESVRETLTHELIHQLAFNSGLHSRVAPMPRWVVEGLAMNLEGSVLNANLSGRIEERINRARFQQFQEARRNGKLLPIADLVADGEPYYSSNPLNFYGESWALTFYLAEKRRPEYLAYLNRLSERDPMKNPYSPAERLADFQACFGTDLKWLEVEFLRFMESLPSESTPVAGK